MFSPILAILKILQCLANKKILVKFKKSNCLLSIGIKRTFFFIKKAVFILFLGSLSQILCFILPKSVDRWKQKGDLPLLGHGCCSMIKWSLLRRSLWTCPLPESRWSCSGRNSQSTAWKSHKSRKPTEWAKTRKFLRSIS